MKTSDFYYDLPEERIAQKPVEPRDSSRLLVYRRDDRSVTHTVFRHVIDYLQPGDALIINDTRVMPARLLGVRPETGGKIELLLLHRRAADTWEVLAKPGRKAVPGQTFVFGDGLLTARITAILEDGKREAVFTYQGVFEEVLDRCGVMPLPPYIHAALEDRERYQTVYARLTGSAAAPTAGLHFTPELLEAIRAKGVTIVPVLLHVGLGTFRPVKVEDVTQHIMHSEAYEVTQEAADTLNAIRARGGRWICVGTTSARTLETVTDDQGVAHAGAGETKIFIYPGYTFHGVDALITNFHLPESTLLMMISALASREEILRVYEIAVKEKYRFFSFGDAMLIL